MNSPLCPHLLACLLLLLLLPFLLAGPAGAANPISTFQVDLGAAPHDPAAADATRAGRALAALQAVACGREEAFLHDAQVKSAGEDVVNRLTAKVALLQRGMRNCQFVANMPIGFDAASFNQAVATQFGADCAQVVRFAAHEPASQVEINEGITGGHIRATFLLTSECLRRQVNQVISAMQVKGQPGTDKLPCHPGADFKFDETTEGDWDASVRDLVRIYYLAKPRGDAILDPATREHLFNDLLTIDGAPGPDDYPVAGCGNTERSTGSPSDRADERSWAEDNFAWLSDVWDVLKWILLIIILIILIILLVILTVATAGASLPLWAVIPLVAVEVAVALGIAAAVVATVLVSLARIPETENHLLMINTSRFLTNQLIIEANPADVHFFVDDQKEVKTWLLKRLQRIATDDFAEYNARPYQRYSLVAILNLHDFVACDPARATGPDCNLRTAAQVVLDLASAKYAVGSNQGRRSVPFRRLMDAIADDFADGRRLTEGDSGSDYLIGFMLLYTGHTHHLPEHRSQFGTAAEMIYPATSLYAPPPAVMSVAFGAAGPVEQRFSHAGAEIYSSTPNFLITAGGVQASAADKFSISLLGDIAARCVDRGAAVPTTLIPSGGGYLSDPELRFVDAVRREDFLRIEGLYYPYEREGICFKDVYDKGEAAPPPQEPNKADRKTMWSHDGNVCVAKGFACGVNILVPPALAPCFQSQAGSRWAFLHSAACPGLPNSADFYVALYRRPCPRGAVKCVNNWGFFEAVDATPGAAGAAGFVAFKLRTLAANPDNLIADPPDASLPPMRGTYVSANGERIAFDVTARPGVSAINGVAVPALEHWERAEGTVVNSSKCISTMFPFYTPSKYEITGKSNGVTLDFCNTSAPSRTLH